MKLIDRRMEYYNRRNLYFANIKDKGIRKCRINLLGIRIAQGDIIQSKLKERKPR